ncbi:hypothetical protein B0A55_10188 [Friedmanniomyces simplex]|uniref:Haloacid dehalogenase-like hydrolase domain-containing protein 3 n=1 Tax=Friedmanniomyces simplex TaxID=329884 RepID=A0A4U0WKK5_9PEZI|nr:hypothetical protein B0A55_10188 [Friedmanniomyces simplex]
MAKRNLLICFDAFGTLFKPKRPIAQQYGEVARSLGLGGFTDEQVHDSFRAAFKHETKENPNFGKANGLNSTTWWTNIIHNTFHPLVGPNVKLHQELAPRLLYRFSSEEAYELLPDVLPVLQDLRNTPPRSIDRIAVGVITNSDDRVPSVLTSLGLRVSPLTYGIGEARGEPPPGEKYDIDFTVMSYEVGYEKPDRRIFIGAEQLLSSLPAAADTDLESWEKVYVGDEYEKDVVGALNAGWHGVILKEAASSIPDDVQELDERTPGGLLPTLGGNGSAVSISSFSALAKALGIVPEMHGGGS